MNSALHKKYDGYTLTTHNKELFNLKQLPPETQNIIADFLPISGVLLELFTKNKMLSRYNAQRIADAFVHYVRRSEYNKTIEIPLFFKQVQPFSQAAIYLALGSKLNTYNTTIELYSAGESTLYNLKPVVLSTQSNDNVTLLAACTILMIQGNIAQLSTSVLEAFPQPFQDELKTLKRNNSFYTFYKKTLQLTSYGIVPCFVTSPLIVLGYLAYFK